MSDINKKSRTGAADRLRKMYADDPDFDQAADLMRKLNDTTTPPSDTRSLTEKPILEKITPVGFQRSLPTLVIDSREPTCVTNTGYQRAPSTDTNGRFQQSISTDVDKSKMVLSEPNNIVNKVINTVAKRLMWGYLKQRGSHPTTNQEVSNNTGIAIGTVRDILRSFEKAGLIKKSKIMGYGRNQGLEIKILIEDNFSFNFQQAFSTGVFNSRTNHSIDRQKDYNLIENLSIYTEHVEKLKNFSNDDIAFHYPSLAEIGFKTDQIDQIIDRLLQANKTPEYLFDAFEYIEWALTHGGIKTPDGNAPKSVLDYIFVSLCRSGTYRKPPGFMSQREIALKDKADQLAAEAKELIRIKEGEFEVWKAYLTKEQKKEIEEELIKKTPRHLLGPEDVWLKDYWKTNISK